MGRITNTTQAEAWNGYEGAQWARSQERWDAINDGFNQPLLDAAGIRDTDQVLDIGCGAGRTTRLAAQRCGGGGPWEWICRVRCSSGPGRVRHAKECTTCPSSKATHRSTRSTPGHSMRPSAATA